MDNNNMMNNGGSDFNNQPYQQQPYQQQPNQQSYQQQPGQQPYPQQFEQPPYQQSGYPQGNYYAQPGENRSKVKEILALVFGILAILISCCCTYLGIGLGIASIVMAVLSKNENNGKMPGMALGGMICSIFAIVLCVVSIILVLTGVVDVDFTRYLNGL